MSTHTGSSHRSGDPGEEWLELAARVAALARRAGLGTTATALDTLVTRLSKPTRRIGFVGRTCVGKSHLINQLIGQDMLDTGEVPTTTRCHLLRPSSADDAGQVGPAWITVPCDHSWLVDEHLELVDMPGIDVEADDRFAGLGSSGLFEGRRAVAAKDVQQVVDHALAGCDVVVLVTSATQPLPRTDQAILKNLVDSSAVQAVMVVVTMTDQVKGETEDVLRRIRRLAGDIAPGCAVLTAPTGTGDPRMDQALRQGIREALQSAGSGAQLLPLRMQRLTESLQNTVHAISRMALDGLADESLAQAERAARQNALERERLVFSAAWTSARHELLTAAEAAHEEIREEARRARTKAVALLEQTVRTHQDPLAVWDSHIPFALRTELADFANLALSTARSSLRAAVVAAFDRLSEALEHESGSGASSGASSGSGSGSGIESGIDHDVDAYLALLDDMDVEAALAADVDAPTPDGLTPASRAHARLRLLFEGTGAVLDLALNLAFSALPVARVVTAPLVFVEQKLADRSVAARRDVAIAHVPAAVQDAFDACLGSFRAEIDTVYRRCADLLESSSDDWWNRQEAALTVDGGAEWRNIRSQAVALAEEIRIVRAEPSAS
ncbi:GTPase [Streptomyces sporangiiformans]|uniref:GTPase n=1 Tax=Streptomyces sporangiiformans TaxID=2315329 RepID=UPI0013C3F1CF|nr:GTPase [Streptomyces sporangiiformans]